MVAGCLLCDASPASAQTMAVVAPPARTPAGHLHAGHGPPGGPGQPAPHLSSVTHARSHPAHPLTPAATERGHGATGPARTSLRVALPGVTTTPAAGGPAAKNAKNASNASNAHTAKTAKTQGPTPPATAHHSNPQSSSQARNSNGNGNRAGNPSQPSGGAARTGNTATAGTVTVSLPASGPVRPERFFVLPLASLTPIAAAGGPLPSGAALPFEPVRQLGRELFHTGMARLPENWLGDSLKESGKLKLPIALLAAIGVFMLIQALVDRRDPKVSNAPERQSDDSVGFE